MDAVLSFLNTIQQFIGILDITIVLVFVISIYLGFKKGFFQKILSMAGSLSGIVIALIFAGSFSSVVSKICYSSVYNKVSSGLAESEAMTVLNGSESIDEGVTALLTELGLPSFLSSKISSMVDTNAAVELSQRLLDSFSSFFTTIIIYIIAFFSLWIGIIIVVLLLRVVLAIFRTSKIFKIIDGILGIALYVSLTFLVFIIIFLILPFILNIPGLENIQQFVYSDIRMETLDGVNLARWFYTDNIAANFFRIFF